MRRRGESSFPAFLSCGSENIRTGSVRPPQFLMEKRGPERGRGFSDSKVMMDLDQSFSFCRVLLVGEGAPAAVVNGTCLGTSFPSRITWDRASPSVSSPTLLIERRQGSLQGNQTAVWDLHIPRLCAKRQNIRFCKATQDRLLYLTQRQSRGQDLQLLF